MPRDFRKDWREYLHNHIPTKDKLPQYLYDILRKENVKKILDLGCGIGKFTIDFYLRGFTVVGLDINPEAIKYAKSKADEVLISDSTNTIRFCVGDATSLELDESPFDAVIMQLLISLIGNKQDRIRLLEKARKFLKVNGILYFSASGLSDDINENYRRLYEQDFPITHERGTYLSRDELGNVLYWTHHFSESEIRELLEKSFTIISLMKEKEVSSRRPNEAAYFFYVVAKRK